MSDADLDFRALFEQSPDTLLVLLPDAPRFTMIAATDARLAATHATREATLGKGVFEIFGDNPDDAAATGVANLRASLERVLATRAPDTMPVQKYDIRGPDGRFEVRYWSPKNVPVLSPTGDVRYILHRVEDVTELVRAAEQGEALRDRTRQMENEVIQRGRELHDANLALRQANARLGELDAAKTAFFSNVSHEFRTPLTLMLAPLEDALSDGREPLGARQRERIRLVHDNALRLAKLVNALLDFSRIEAGRMRASFTATDVGALTTELASMFDSSIRAAGLRYVVECARGETAWVDRELWDKIVVNLVANAFKYTLAGEIAVRLRAEERAFVLEVADTGVGIPAGELPRIFDRFHRVAGVVGRTHEGTGIGLALVRELVELHGGSIAVESEPGRGSTFRVTIPRGNAHLPADALSAAPPNDAAHVLDAAAHRVEAQRWIEPGGAPQEPTTTTTTTGERPRVLVVDDNPDLRHYMASLLADAYDVTVARDGREALARVAEAPPEIVLSDVSMPNLDGLGLVRELRGRPETASVPVILLSARAGEDSAIEGLDAGSDDYLAKPFSARELLARVRTHLELARARRAWVAQLEAANRELDAFSYSVAHDLRAPLRAIDGFSRALLEEYRGALDERGADYLQRVCAAVGRMNGLIDALLALSRISRAPLEKERVDLTALARSINDDLARESPGRNVVVDVAGELTAHGDRALLSVLLTNLLANAWKFSARRAVAHIAVGCQSGPEPAFFVRDDGAGFSTRYASRLFAPFQRLHSPRDFEGTGIGLATAQRVVARHGGRIWAEAEVDKGATFYFTLPS